MHCLRRAILIAALLTVAHSMTTPSARADGFRIQDKKHIETTVQKFMDTYDVPGLSIAISKNGRLVLASGFGVADKATQTPVTSKHRFRVASVSKPITSIAIHSLIQQGKLSYDTRVFGKGSILGTEHGEKPYTENLKRITVGHLLTHTAGGWDNKGNDPMFMRPELDHQDLIGWTLDNQPLEHEPGTEYAYSNFGYCLLGRIIERVTKQSYEDFVTRQIFAPIHAKSFAIAGNRELERLPNEVTYYGAAAKDPYGLNVTRMDAHGGWVATATDLVLLAVHYDGFPRPADRLSPVVLRHMMTPSEANQNYAKGWSVNKFNNWWHVGSLPGTGAILVRASNGYCWAVLVNTQNPKEGFNKALDALPWDIVRGVKQWPTSAGR